MFNFQREVCRDLQAWLAIIIEAIADDIVLNQWILLLQYMQGKLFVLQVHRNFCSARHVVTWKRRLDSQNITPQSYDRDWFMQRNIVYLKIHPRISHWYIGHSGRHIHDREGMRIRKLRQLKKGMFISTEMAVHFWHKFQCFFQYVPVVLSSHPSKEIANYQENYLTKHFQPSLAVPWIHSHFKLGKQTSPTHSTCMQFHSFGNKLYQKVRKKLQVGRKDAYHTKSQALTELYALGKFTFARFATMKRLIHYSTPGRHVYALLRHAQYLDEPRRSIVKQALKKILQKKKLPVPRPPLAIAVPFLASADFKSDLKKLISRWVLQSQFIPYHAPPCKPLESKHHSLDSSLHNWKRNMKQWTISPPKVCQCAQLTKRFPHVLQRKGHVATPLQDIFQEGTELHKIATACAKDTYFPSKEKFFMDLRMRLDKWALYHKLDRLGDTEFENFKQRQWKLHVQALQDKTKHHFKNIAAVRKHTESFVVHCQDHAANKLMMFCPLLYYQLILDTFEQGPVFQKVNINISSLSSTILRDKVPSVIKKRYAWGIKPDRPFPSAYIFPKAKKQWSTARPIIAYYKTIFADLLTALGKVLKDVTDVAYPNHLHQETMPQVFISLHRFFKENDDVTQHVFYNEDLEGFYTSIPQERITAATVHMMEQYLKHHPSQDPSTMVLSVNLSTKQRIGRTIRGKSYARQNLTKQIRFCDIPVLVEFAITCSYITVMGQVFKQKRGAPIGSQTAPSICNYTVAFEEYVWQHTYHIVNRSDTLIQRYVDNRLAIIPKTVAQQTGYQHFLTLDFYQPPVQLLRVEDTNYVGFDIFLQQREIRYIMPKESWQFRSPMSAGSDNTLYSGFRSRIHIILRGVFPRTMVRPTIQKLTDQYVAHGHCRKTLEDIWKKCIYRYRFGLQ